MSEEQSKDGRLERHHRVLVGEVVSDKMDKTIVVQVMRRYRHPQYRKYVTEKVKYKAHDEDNTFKTGETVRIEETRPYSKLKTWKVLDRVQAGKAAAVEADV